MKLKGKGLATILIAGALTLAACGGSSDSSSESTSGGDTAATEESGGAEDSGGAEAASDNPAAADCSILGPGANPPRAGGDKYIVYATSLNIGNSWQEEAFNTARGVASMPPYSDCVEVRTARDEPDPQAQISQIQSMVAAGADGIISYALSPTAINAAYQEACDAGVTVVVYDATATNPCVYNVSYITSVPQGIDGQLVENPFMGYNAMDQLLQLMGGPGEIFVSHGVVGTSTDIVHYGSALAAMENYQGTEILTEYEGRWDSAQQQKETAKALGSFPNVQGIFGGYGESGVVKALDAVGKEIPVSGETSNYFRLRLLEGYPGVSIGSPPSQGAIGMKVVLAVILNGPEGIPHDIEVPYRIVTAENVTECTQAADEPATEYCNVFPAGVVGDENTADIFNEMAPEVSLVMAQTGEPTPNIEATPYTAEYLQQFEQDLSRRYITREACPDGWTKGMLPQNVEGCIQG
jgi:ribose transport system substrate-binding protein